MIQLWLIQNAMKLLAALAVVTITLGSISYWKHTIAEETNAKCNAAWIERDRIDVEHSKLLYAERQGEIRAITQNYEDHNERELTKYREYVKTLTIANAASNDRVNKLQRHSERKVSCPVGGETEADNTGGIGGTGSEAVQIDKSLKALEIVMEEYVLRYFEVVK